MWIANDALCGDDAMEGSEPGFETVYLWRTPRIGIFHARRLVCGHLRSNSLRFAVCDWMSVEVSSTKLDRRAMHGSAGSPLSLVSGFLCAKGDACCDKL